MLVRVRLVEEDLWQRFAWEQNEMIITRTGRCLFPLLRIQFELVEEVPPPVAATTWPVINLAPSHQFTMAVAIVPSDTMRWRYRGNRWVPVLSAEFRNSLSSSLVPSSTESSQENLFGIDAHGDKLYATPSSRNPGHRMHLYDPLEGHQISGEDLFTKGMSFSHLKITNRPYEGFEASGLRPAKARTRPNSPNFCLNSFHRYHPLIYLLDHDESCDDRSLAQVLRESPRLPPSLICFTLPLTQFIAVTHYQNERITELKKSFNPHAKGFIAKALGAAGSEEEDDGEDKVKRRRKGKNRTRLGARGSSVALSPTDSEDEALLKASQTLASLKSSQSNFDG